jgi:putative PEP-CTERM system histidine kinase
MNVLDALPLFNILLTTVLALVVWRRNPRVLVTKIFALGVLTVVLVELGHFLARVSGGASGSFLWYQFALASLCFLPVTWSLFSLVLFQPRPKDILRKKRIYLGLLILLGSGFLSLLLAGRLVVLPGGAKSPWLGAIRFTGVGRWFLIYLLLTTVIMLVTLENTYRRVKQRGGRYALYGLISSLFYLIFLCSQGLLFSRIPSPTLYLGSGIITISSLLVAYDIVRYRLLEVDIYVGRGAIYSSAILLLVGGYLVLMGLVAKLVRVIGGNLSLFFTILAAFVVLLMSLVLLLSGSLKKRLKLFIDRNFYHGRYDYREQWLRFSEEMSSLLNLDVIVARFLQMALETVDAHRGCVMTPGESGGDFRIVESIDLNGDDLRIPEGSDFLDWLFILSHPIELSDARFEKNVSAAISSQRDRFLDLGLVVLVPLVTKRKLVGLLALGPVRSGSPYTGVDLELLEAIGNHLSMAILNAKLSQELVINRELEFMHKVSSFVVHDLKNSVSTLSMLLENAASNMEDPQFRQNMVRTIAGTVERMKGLMGRIRTMPKDMPLNRQPQDLNQVVHEVVLKTKIDRSRRIEFVEDLQEIPATNVDRAYLEKVLTNLIINAVEAMPEGGALRVSTRVVQNGTGPGVDDARKTGRWVQIEVADSGEGMSQEFIKRRLFRPFQTTKKKGLGIGLYQCREVVEAHGGQIEVTSIEQEGTVFTIRLPVQHSIGKESE